VRSTWSSSEEVREIKKATIRWGVQRTIAEKRVLTRNMADARIETIKAHLGCVETLKRAVDFGELGGPLLFCWLLPDAARGLSRIATDVVD
jgi:hypothetical protein